jgi:hypothetical protein
MLVQPIDHSASDGRDAGNGPGQPSCFDLPGGLRLIILDESDGVGPMVDSGALPSPRIKVALPLVEGGTRQMIVYRPNDCSRKRDDVTARGRQLTGAIEPSAGIPLDRTALIRDLDPTGKLRLVRQLLDVCRDIFHLKSDAAYSRLCRTLLSDIAPDPAECTAEAVIDQHLALASAPVPAYIGEVSGVIIISERGIGGAQYGPLRVAKDKILVLLDRASFRAGNLLVIIGAKGFVTARVIKQPRTPFLTWLQANKQVAQATRAFVMRSVADLADQGMSTAALLRELELFQPPIRRNLTDKKMPVGAAVELLISDGNGGVFIKGWLRDPHHLIIGVHLTASALSNSVLTKFGCVIHGRISTSITMVDRGLWDSSLSCQRRALPTGRSNSSCGWRPGPRWIFWCALRKARRCSCGMRCSARCRQNN